MIAIDDDSREIKEEGRDFFQIDKIENGAADVYKKRKGSKSNLLPFAKVFRLYLNYFFFLAAFFAVFLADFFAAFFAVFAIAF